MDFEPEGFDLPIEGGGVRHNRFTVVVDDHTHIYEFPDDQAGLLMNVIRRHISEKILDPYAGYVLLTMIGDIDEF